MLRSFNDILSIEMADIISDVLKFLQCTDDLVLVGFEAMERNHSVRSLLWSKENLCDALPSPRKRRP